MSGREPVAAFFPSIDRNLMAELDRHLRAPPVAEPDPRTSARPDIENVVEAVEHAASSIAAMTDHIHELETRIASLDATNRQLIVQLGQSNTRREAAEADAQTHRTRAEDCERIAVQHVERADALERDLATALTDLNRVTDAIANALGLP